MNVEDITVDLLQSSYPYNQTKYPIHSPFYSTMFKRSSTARAMPSALPQTSPNVQVQKLPLKCVGSIDSLVEALQELTESLGDFKVEVSWTTRTDFVDWRLTPGA